MHAESSKQTRNCLKNLFSLLLQDIVMREAMVMRQQRHPNVLPLLAAFLSEAVLWMVMPYVAGGSAIHILNKRCPGVSSISSCFLHTCTICTATWGSRFACAHSSLSLCFCFFACSIPCHGINCLSKLCLYTLSCALL